MISVRIENKASFRLIGFKTILDEGTAIHAAHYSPRKTTFFKNMIEGGQMASLRPLSESAYGFAAVVCEQRGIAYYAGVPSTKPMPDSAEELFFPQGDYLVLSGSGGLSRLAFDRLEDHAFGAILTEQYEYAYAEGPIAEVLLNGNPMDAEVEVWVPVARRDAV